MDFLPTCLGKTSLYDHASQPEWITVRRLDLEHWLRTIIEKTMVEGGDIAELARDCMLALDMYSDKRDDPKIDNQLAQNMHDSI